MFFLQSQIVERAMEVSPGDRLVYGLLVAIPIAVCVALWKKLNAEQAAHMATMKDSLGVLKDVAQHLAADTELKKNIQRILTIIESKFDVK